MADTQQALRVALDKAREDAKSVFADSCNHTHEAIEYMHALLVADLTASSAQQTEQDEYDAIKHEPKPCRECDPSVGFVCEVHEFAQPTEQAQPVAWRVDTHGKVFLTETKALMESWAQYKDAKVTPFYAAPSAAPVAPITPWQKRCRDGSAIADYRAMEEEIHELRAALAAPAQPAAERQPVALNELPPLPEPKVKGNIPRPWTYYTADQMREYAKLVLSQAQAAPTRETSCNKKD